MTPISPSTPAAGPQHGALLPFAPNVPYNAPWN